MKRYEQDQQRLIDGTTPTQVGAELVDGCRLEKKYKAVEERSPALGPARYELAILRGDREDRTDMEIFPCVYRHPVDTQCSGKRWSGLYDLFQAVGSTAGRDRADETKPVLVVTDRPTEFRRPEGAEISENHHCLEEARLARSVRTQNRICCLSKGKNLV